MIINQLSGLFSAGIKCHQERARRFVQLWTLKEAYVKAHGQGISAAPGLKGFSILLQPDSQIASTMQHITTARPADTAYRIQFQSDYDNSHRWWIMLLDLSGKHTAALCVEQSPESMCVKRQDSADSDASTSTVYNQGSSATASSESSQQRTESREAVHWIQHRCIVPLADEGVELACQMQGASLALTG